MPKRVVFFKIVFKMALILFSDKIWIASLSNLREKGERLKGIECEDVSPWLIWQEDMVRKTKSADMKDSSRLRSSGS